MAYQSYYLCITCFNRIGLILEGIGSIEVVTRVLDLGLRFHAAASVANEIGVNQDK